MCVTFFFKYAGGNKNGKQWNMYNLQNVYLKIDMHEQVNLTASLGSCDYVSESITNEQVL